MIYLKKNGFTLIEVLIASSIFAVVGLIAVNVFVNIIRTQRRVSLENMIYEDARFMLQRIGREIRENTVDYEEYYNRVIEGKTYGTTYGCYANRFYNPGNPPKLGAECNDGGLPKNNPNCVIDKKTLDVHTGQNPFAGTVVPDKKPEDASAFCDKTLGPDFICTSNFHVRDELYLIDPKGGKKTFIARKETSQNKDYAVALLSLSGEDSDKNGIVETWTGCAKNNEFCCAKGFTCDAVEIQKMNPLQNLEATKVYQTPPNNYQGFIPISPSRTTITSMRFLVSPLEDPRKAFAETTPDIQQQPHVTIILSVKPAQSSLQNYSGDPPEVTIQTTVTSNVYNEVRSYFANPVCK